MLDILTNAMENISERDVSFADIRHETHDTTSLGVINGSLRGLNQRAKAGVIARVLVGECWGQATTTEMVTKDVIKELLSEATKIARTSAKHSRKDIDLSNIPSHVATVWQDVKENPADVSLEEKIELTQKMEKALKIDDRLVKTESRYVDSRKVFRLVNTAGSRLEWDEIQVSSIAIAVAREGSKMQYDYKIKGSQAGYEFIRSIDPAEIAENCAKGAIDLLGAEKPPSGQMTVIMDGDISGLVAHEVCGHASEADEVVKGRSFLTNMQGVQIGNDSVSMIDDGSIKGLGGSIPFDSEGTPGSRTTIIENGIFKGYLHNLETAIIMGVAPTGNGRSQDYNRRIFARMTNTFFDKGTWSNEEIIEDTKDGVYIIKTLSGMEDVVGGGVQATALKGYLIKDGEKKTLLRSMTIAGKVLAIMKTIDAVGNTLQFSGGSCGKGEEDFIPVTSGGPHMRGKMMVGGG